MSITILIIFSVELFMVYCFSRSNEKDRVAYKVIIEFEEYNEKQECEYVFRNEGDKMAIQVYPVVYENGDVYILSRLYKEENETKMDYNYQRIIEKENIETIFYDNIYDINWEMDTVSK